MAMSNCTNRNRTPALAAVILAALLVTACSKPEDVRLEIYVSAPQLLKDTKIELLADGKLVPLLRTRDESGIPARIYEVHGVIDGEEKKLPALKLRVLFGCGWREQVLKLQADRSVKELRAAAARGEPSYFSPYVESFPGQLAQLWVDNRNGGPGELGIGAIKTTIPAGTKQFVQTVTCDTPIPVTFDGAAMGEIPGLKTDARDFPTILLDPSGKRCYEKYKVWYGTRNLDGSSGGRSASEWLSGRHLYYSEQFIAYMFKKAPSMVMAQQGMAPTYHVLEDAKCK
jgi:hypothetical protein